MFKENYVTEKKSNVFIVWILLITVNLTILNQVKANEKMIDTLSFHSVSKGSLKLKSNEKKQKKIVETMKVIKEIDNSVVSKNRDDILKKQKLSNMKPSKGLAFQSNTNNYNPNFEIYSATSFLLDDYDNDGFYQTFSIVFDADLYSYSENNTSEVYALLYLSKNGNPWTHYFSTDNFIIDGDSDLDEYEVITTILSGYSTDHYDVLIDLYQVGYNEVVATYSSDDNNDLYALALESANYDEPYIEVLEVYAGGFSILTLLIIIVSFALRISLNKHNK